MHHSSIRTRSLSVAAAAVALALTTAACGNDPFTITWISTPDTALLYTLARPELGLETAFDFFGRTRFVVERPGSTNNWDVAVDTRDGKLVLLPPGALDVVNEARVTVIEGVSFDDVVEAPADTSLYSSDQPVLLELGNVYAVRTREQRTSFGVCSLYAKIEPLILDQEVGSVTFVYDYNPRCDDRRLQPDQTRDEGGP